MGTVGLRHKHKNEGCFNHTGILCTACQQRGRQSHALKYCTSCEEFTCKKCLKSHKSKHKLLRYDVDKILDMVRCSDHSGKIIDMICETHDEVGCKTCMATKHGGPCRKLYIQQIEMDDVMGNAERYQETCEKLQSSIEKLENMIALRDTCQNNLQKAVEKACLDLDHYFTHLESHSNRLILRMTALYQKTKFKLASLAEEKGQALNDQISALDKETLDREIVAAKQLLELMATTASSDKIPQIVCSKLADKATCILENAIKEHFWSDIKPISFQPNLTYDNMFQIFDSLENSFGEFRVVRSYKTKLRYTRDVSAKAAEGVYDVTSDKYDCQITGSCTLLNGSILFVDHNNSCLKRMLPRAYMVSDIIQFCFLPSAICVINQQEVAVTMEVRERVQIVSLGMEMALTRKFDVGFKCSGIAHHAGTLYISGGWRTSRQDTVHLYSVTGELLGQICPNDIDGKGMPLFGWIWNLAVSDCGRVLYGVGAGLTAIDIKTRRVIWWYRADDLWQPSDVCVDRRGSVFVCGGDDLGRPVVKQFSEGGKRLEWTTTENDEIEALPYSVCYDQLTSRLFVSKYRNNDKKVRERTCRTYYWWNNDVVVWTLAN